jgi:uncharacterized protein (DUF362 family)
LRLATGLAGGLIISPILQACQKLGLVEPTGTPVPTSTQTEPSSPPTPVATALTESTPTASDGLAKVALVRTRDRQDGVRRAISLLGENSLSGKQVFLKPNLNSADAAPASTHPDTLRALVESLQEMGARGITVADRSGMGDTRRVMGRLGVFDLGLELGFDTLVFDELRDPDDWVLVSNPGDHWGNGFPVPRQLLEAEAIVQTCCLKPHRFGGHFTMSLKNTVGMVGKFKGSSGYNYMTELHNSPFQRLMIAEVNRIYQPALVLLDGVEAFIDQGPDLGTRVWGDVILAGTDRVAIDAVGLALLRLLGYRGVAAKGSIFGQEQIARAVELGLGIDGPEKISFITDDQASGDYAALIHEHLRSSG